MERKRHLTAGFLVAICAASMISEVSADDHRSVFKRLDELEARATRDAQLAEQLSEQLPEIDAQLTLRHERSEIARRAAAPVRKEANRAVVAWLTAFREAERRAGTGPGSGSDLEYLLTRSIPNALPRQLSELDVLQRARTDRKVFDKLLHQRARASVQLAQYRADEVSARRQRREVLAGAKDDPTVREQILATDEALHEAMSRMLKNDTSEDFHRLKGTLFPPVSAAPAYLFGPRQQAGSTTTVRHTGYTYDVPVGTNVTAAARGLVVYARTFEGFGNVVILDHGSGYHTLYAHLDRLAVQQGQRLRRGESVGASGDTGSLDGPKLYFELRKDGRPIDPKSWFLQH